MCATKNFVFRRKAFKVQHEGNKFPEWIYQERKTETLAFASASNKQIIIVHETSVVVRSPSQPNSIPHLFDIIVSFNK